MTTFFLPIAGVVVGVVGSLTGTGGGILAVPLLLWLGFSKETAIGASFINMFFLIAASLTLYGFRGQLDWKTGVLLGVGSLVGSYIGVMYLHPHISEKMFRYIFATFLIAVALSFIFTKK